MIVSWNLYEGVSVIDHCSHCTGLDENLEDVEVTREPRAPGMHRSTLDGNLKTRPTPVHLAVTASMKQGGIIYATAGICWYCRPGSNGSGSGGLNA